MIKYIDKSALVAEIEKRLSLLEGGTGHPKVMERVEGVIKGYKSILSFLDTLEVKEFDSTDAFIEKACEWLKDNWRKHVWLDGDNIIHFGLWENDFRKAMEE